MTLEKSLPSEYYLSDGDLRAGARADLLAGVVLRRPRRHAAGGGRGARARPARRERPRRAHARGEARGALQRVPAPRGAPLHGATRPRRSIRCPYHAWTYGLDGKLLGAPFLNQDPALRQEDFSLYPVGIAALGRLLLPEPLAGRTGRAQLRRPRSAPIPERLARYPLGVARDGAPHRVRRRRQLEGRRRELQRVLPLRRRPPRALRGRAGVQGAGRRGARLGPRHPAPRRRLHLHEERHDDARAVSPASPRRRRSGTRASSSTRTSSCRSRPITSPRSA